MTAALTAALALLSFASLFIGVLDVSPDALPHLADRPLFHGPSGPV